MVDGCSQDKEVPHMRTGDGRHTGLPRPLPRLRRPSGPLRRPVGDPGTCAARWGNVMHGRGTEGISVVSCGGTLLHAPAGCNPPLGSAVTGTPGIPIACRGAATALSGVASVDGAISHTLAALPVVAKIRKARRSRQVCHWGRLPMRSGGPHAEPPPPASIFRFFMRLSFPMRFRGLPTHGPPPHTVSRFPHTTTRLTYFPICHGRSPIARPSPHTIHKLQKSDFHFGEISGSQFHKSQPTLSSKHPGPALPVQQISRQPSHANPTYLRWGWRRHVRARTATGMYAHICTMVILARPCARLHGHGHIPSPRSSRFRTRLRRDQRGRLTQIYTPIRPTQIPWGAWAWRRGVNGDDDAATPATPATSGGGGSTFV